MAGRSPAPRQSDIARLAGVTQATVSLVLNGKADAESIPRATQERVQAAVRELRYVRNVAATSLRGGRSGLVGVHTFERVFPVAPDDYYHPFLVGIEEQAAELKVDLVLFASTQGADGARRIFGDGTNRLRLADGAVMVGLEENADDLVRLAAEQYPFVFIGKRDGASARMPYVAPDYDAALASVLQPLSAAGHKRIGYLGDDIRRNPQSARLTAFTEHMDHLSLEHQRPWLTASADLNADAVRKMLALGNSAIVVEGQQLASALAYVAAEMGLSIPRDLSVVVLDSVPSRSPAHSWSQLQIPRRELGRRALSMLIDLLDGTITNTHHELLLTPPPTLATVAVPRRTLLDQV